MEVRNIDQKEFDDLKKRLYGEVITKAQMSGNSEDDEIRKIIAGEVINVSKNRYMSLEEKKKLENAVFAAIRGYDVLQELLEAEDVTEIMVNGIQNIFYEKAGRLYRHKAAFESREKLDDVIQKIAAGANRMVNEANPILDARLPGGERANIVLSPVAVKGSTITIRKFPKEVMTIDKLIELGSLTEEAADFLRKLVVAGYNIFVSGGTGSGKTTFLNALSDFIPKDQRVITIEDSAELQLHGIDNLVALEARNVNSEGKNAVTIRDLIKSSLRMRPDRIILGEVRDAACVDMLQAFNTGHSGMSTGHSNSPVDMLSRMETMVLLGADIPLAAVRRQIASAVDIIIHLARFRDKTRKVVEITEITGYENGEVTLNSLYRFFEEEEKEGRVSGTLKSTGNRLKRTGKLKAAGINPE